MQRLLICSEFHTVYFGVPIMKENNGDSVGDLALVDECYERNVEFDSFFRGKFERYL